MKRWPLPAALFAFSLALYLGTLAPTVATIFDDSLELQLALPTLAIIHPTGYPLYSLLGWLVTKLVPIGDAAWRANAFSALAAAGAVALFYPTARRLGSNAVPAVVAALLLAVGPVWWSQATIAEVYAFQGLLTLFVLLALLAWDEARGPDRDRRLRLVGLAFGLGLAHHRLTLLLAPAALLFLLWGEPGLLRRPRAWVGPFLALAAPLLSYGLLPLRAHVGSLDGSYERIGFWGWVLGGGYSTFWRENPFGLHRTWADLFGIVLAQYGVAGIVIALVGWPLWRLQPRRFVLLTLIAVTDLVFAYGYRVADIEVFLLPAILALALFIAVGLTPLWDAVLLYLASWSRVRKVPVAVVGPPLAALLLLLWPLGLAWERLPGQDRSHPPARAWGVHDYGRDMLEQVAPEGRVVGLLGEMTLLRYFQRTQGLRPDVETVAADPEPDRLAAIAAGVAAGRPTYTTRPVTGLAESFSLSAAGPLIRVWSPGRAELPPPARTADVSLTPAVRLVGWELTWRRPRSGPAARVYLHWRVEAPVSTDFKVSVRLLATDGALLAQRDDIPVHNTYPPRFWRAGETVRDGYDLALPYVPTNPVTLQVILYRPDDGSAMAVWEQEVE